MVRTLLRYLIPRPANGPLRYVASAIPRRWRMGPGYWTWRRELLAARDWPPERVEAWQLARLQDIIRLAYDRTQGYRELYRQAGVRPEDIRSLADIRHLPFTSKRMFQEHLEEFSVRCVGRQYVTTGGSTGIPLGFYQTAANVAMDRAFGYAAWASAGWRLEDLNAMLRGGFVGSAERPWRYDPYYHTLELSSYQLTERTLGAHLAALRRYRPRVLQAYPSAVHQLCRLLAADPPARPISFDLILLGSENIYPWQLEEVREVFPTATVFGWYGHAEKAIFAPWCPARRTYHVQPLYGLAELIGEDGQEVAETEEGELVGTSFHNVATPFIRYRTMDRAVRGPSPCDACGHRHMVLQSITGRSHELIVTGTGRLISMTAINMHDDLFDDLRQFQFYQEQQGKVAFRYVAKQPLGERQRQRIRQRLMVKLGSDVELSLVAVETIPRTRSGKCSFLDQHLPVGSSSPRMWPCNMQEAVP